MIRDPEVGILAGIAETLRADYEGGVDPWDGSPFALMKTRPSRQVGAIGEQLVAGWCAAKGADVIRARSSDYDRLINDLRVEVKFSTLWASGVFKFQQIRDQEYDVVLCLGVAPFDARCWILPKDLLLEHVIGHMGQHTGATGRDTAWLSVIMNAPLPWLATQGGTLTEAWAVLSALWTPR